MNNAHNKHNERKEIFRKGRNAGIWLSHRLIFPVPLDGMSQRLLNAVAQDASIPGYSKMTEAQLKQALRNKGIHKATFKSTKDGKRELVYV